MNNMEWISVKDKLPNIKGESGFVPVMVTNDGTAIFAYFRYRYAFEGIRPNETITKVPEWYSFCHSCHIQEMLEHVTHWAYMPKPKLKVSNGDEDTPSDE